MTADESFQDATNASRSNSKTTRGFFSFLCKKGKLTTGIKCEKVS